MVRHEPNRSTALPIVGARTGARPLTSISRENSRAVAMPEVTSRTTARERTTPAAALKPWTNRSTARTAIDGATVQSREAPTYAARPTSSGAAPAAGVAHAGRSAAGRARGRPARRSASAGRPTRSLRTFRAAAGTPAGTCRTRAGQGRPSRPGSRRGGHPDATIGTRRAAACATAALYACCGRPSTNGGRPLRIDSTSAMRSRKRQRPSGQRTSLSR